MASLNQIAAQILDGVNQPFNKELLERVKDIIKQERADRFRQSIERNGVDDIMITTYDVGLTKVDAADSCYVELGCEILRTENKIVNPIRYKGDSPFVFIGSSDGKVNITYSQLSEIKNLAYLSIISNIPRYIWINGYVYIYFYDKRKTTIRIQAVNSTEQIESICINGIETCYTDDMEFPLPIDMINSIKAGIYRELGLVPIENKEVKIQENVDK